MNSPQPQEQPTKELLPTSIDKDLLTKIKRTHTHEVVIGLCGPIGAPTRDVALRLSHILKATYNYDPEIKKLSEFIETYTEDTIDKSSSFKRYTSLIDAGNRLRETYGNSVLAELAIADISIKRELNRQSQNSESLSPERFCHIIDSIKNQTELNALKQVYGDLFISIGVYASPSERESRLSQKGISAKELADLFDRDSGEETESGQSVRDTFPRADFFINCSTYNTTEIDQKIARILNIIFNDKISTPTPDETAMYTAYTASLNSACLSRQVGAAVTDKDGLILGTGWNDVPQFKGGLYNSTNTPDNRCYNHGGICHNDTEKEYISTEITEILIKEKIISEPQAKATRAALSKTRIKGLIEFSRAVHAEMHALLISGKANGERINGGSIYVTTYPCHSCARHIIAAGIHKVFYIEPYRKSLALKLHSDALTENTNDPSKVRLIPFEGVSPSRYTDFFSMGNTPRKKDGKLIPSEPQKVNFRAEASLRSFPYLEKTVVEKLTEQELLSPEETKS